MIDLDPLDFAKADIRAALSAMPAPLAAMMQRVPRLLRLTSALAPGLVIIGGEIALSPEEAHAAGQRTISATGTGLTLTEALEGCLGEAAEHLSQFERPGDVVFRLPLAAALECGDVSADGWIGAHLAEHAGATELAWTRAESEGGGMLIPADLSLRRAPEAVVLPAVGALSSGCAAGATFEAATERATLELIERDAAALWWYGGQPPAAVDDATYNSGHDLLKLVRQGVTSRNATFLDLTTDLGVPVMAAVSVNADGRGFACGLAARRDAHAALSAAIRELCQMELSAPLAALKLEAGGRQAVSDADLRHLQRASFDMAGCASLQPNGRRRQTAQVDRRTLAAILAACHVPVACLKLTRHDIGVPAARAVASHLQPFAEAPATGRLLAARAQFGGGVAASRGIPLV